MLKQFKHLVAFDLSSYGTALQIINHFVDDENIKVFEISPCGTSAILILVSQDLNALSVLKIEALSLFKQQILQSCLLENFHDELLPTYLSQNKIALSKNLIIFESTSLAKSLSLVDQHLKRKINLVDFRVIRTSPINVVLTFSAEEINQAAQNLDENFKMTVIENIQPSVRSFYEIT